jgi:hypothetical protein
MGPQVSLSLPLLSSPLRQGSGRRDLVGRRAPGWGSSRRRGLPCSVASAPTVGTSLRLRWQPVGPAARHGATVRQAGRRPPRAGVGKQPTGDVLQLTAHPPAVSLLHLPLAPPRGSDGGRRSSMARGSDAAGGIGDG